MVLVAALGTAAGLVPAHAAEKGPAAEVVIPLGARELPPEVRVSNVSAVGFESYAESSTGNHRWTDFATGAQHDVADVVGTEGTDQHSGIVAKETAAEGSTPGRVDLTDLASGRTVAVPVPAGTVWTRTNTADSIVVAVRAEDRKTYTALRQIRVTDGKAVARDLAALPKGTEYAMTSRQDGRGAVIALSGAGGKVAWHLLDYAAGSLVPLHADSGQLPVVLGRDHLAWRAAGEATVHTVPRKRPGTAPVNVAVPAGTSATDGVTGLVGDWVLFRHTPETTPTKGVAGPALYGVPIKGGAARELLPHASDTLRTAPDGSVLAAGGPRSTAWAVQRIRADRHGVPRLSVVRALAHVYQPVDEFTLGAGRLHYTTRTPDNETGMYEQDLATTGRPVPTGERRLVTTLPGRLPVSLGNGQFVWNLWGDHQQPDSPNSAWQPRLPEPAKAIGMPAASGRYVVLDADDGKQYVGDFLRPDDLALTLPTHTAAALWGSTLWKPAADIGSVESYDVKTGKKAPAVNTGSGCVPTKLQAVGRWLYWECSYDKTGVFDLTERKNIAAPPLGTLGDGFVVTKDYMEGRLLLTDLRKGTTVPFSTPGVWIDDFTVDVYGGHVAYTDTDQLMHIKPTGIARQAVSVIESGTDATAVTGSDPWNARFFLSRPVARWTVIFTDGKGRTVATRSGTAREGTQIAPVWDGKDNRGNAVAGGRHTWKLTAAAGDGTGVRALASGTVDLGGAEGTARD
ncbi:hypothetical protein GCM10010329_23200 [Streptomyces spiroverticillatus]|uniref:FlgD/Vpr Ig-like domain-containing protein n=1 Tax=Streptomyces finlayi TaxID=67296 RepID=A0A918WVD0_9ACTN|nr:hypothetical protein GCM10010329_23200 [Streptomyces spiroverticillatus]GHC85127.1 hypothetical protein GCM10010334_15620 [Streptomyces finlayi]